MRISGQNVRGGVVSVKFALAGFAAFLLAGCSDSIERFSANYNNPSDSDPVYTASIPQVKRPVSKYKAPTYQAPQVAAQAEETIVQSPIANAPVAQLPTPKYDYSNAYKKAYRQPRVVAQAPAVETQVAPILTRPKMAFNRVPVQPVYKAPTYKAPVIQNEQAAADEPAVKPMRVKPLPVAPDKKLASSTITVSPGMTLYSIAKANHLSVQQLAAANNISAPYTVSQGKVLHIPGAHAAQMPQVAEAKTEVIEPVLKIQKPEIAQATTTKVKASGTDYVVASGDTLFSVGRAYKVSPFAIADLNGLSQNKPLALGQKIKIPSAASLAQAKPAAVEKTNVAEAEMPKKPGVLALPKEIPPAAQAANTAPVPAEPAAQLAMRWPLKGKVISGFGPKTNGMKNEGINIAVPEGTNIQAAEGGVVAYAGNELKGYGNLVLIRHAGGYVTAYAHASQLLVKKGDQVKRGDIIAKAGQTGAVQSPQLHFEVRKGATALDPSKFLNASTAMN